MLGLGIVSLILIGIALLLPVIAIIDLIRKPFGTEKKLFWVIVILLIPYVGSLFYMIAGRK